VFSAATSFKRISATSLTLLICLQMNDSIAVH